MPDVNHLFTFCWELDKEFRKVNELLAASLDISLEDRLRGPIPYPGVETNKGQGSRPSGKTNAGLRRYRGGARAFLRFTLIPSPARSSTQHADAAAHRGHRGYRDRPYTGVERPTPLSLGLRPSRGRSELGSELDGKRRVCARTRS